MVPGSVTRKNQVDRSSDAGRDSRIGSRRRARAATSLLSGVIIGFVATCGLRARARCATSGTDYALVAAAVAGKAVGVPAAPLLQSVVSQGPDPSSFILDGFSPELGWSHRVSLMRTK
jgi:hypothetical protein